MFLEVYDDKLVKGEDQGDAENWQDLMINCCYNYVIINNAFSLMWFIKKLFNYAVLFYCGHDRVR